MPSLARLCMGCVLSNHYQSGAPSVIHFEFIPSQPWGLLSTLLPGRIFRWDMHDLRWKMRSREAEIRSESVKALTYRNLSTYMALLFSIFLLDIFFLFSPPRHDNEYWWFSLWQVICALRDISPYWSIFPSKSAPPSLCLSASRWWALQWSQRPLEAWMLCLRW